MILKPIRTLPQYRLALRRIEKLMDAKPGTQRADEAQLLYMVIAAFESQYADLPEVEPVVAIEYRMKQLGLTRRDMIPYFGTESRVSEVLNGKRKLTVDMIAALHYGLGIPFASLIRLSAGDARRFGKLRHEPVVRLKALRMRRHPVRKRGRPAKEVVVKQAGRLPRALKTSTTELLPAEKLRLKELLKDWRTKTPAKNKSESKTVDVNLPRYEKIKSKKTVAKKVRKAKTTSGIITLPKRKK